MVNIYKPELTNLQQGILNLLFAKPSTSFNMIRLSQYLDVSQPAIKKAIPLLEKKNLIKLSQDKESKRYNILLNRDNPEIIQLKRANNLEKIYLSKLPSFFFDSIPGTTAILFGSYSRGEDSEISDIDIAIIGASEKEIPLSKFQKYLDRSIFLHFYNSFKDIKDENLKNNILNGIVLYGGVKL
jgi:predicted nucleotidyltransferase